MGLYKKEIKALQEQVKQLNNQRTNLQKVINKTTDQSLIKIYQDELMQIIDDIDELEQAIERMENHDEGSPNGYDELSDEVDYSDNRNWPKLRGLFGFGKKDKPTDN